MNRHLAAGLGELPSPEKSALMSRIRVSRTTPEAVVFALLKPLRYKFTRNAKWLPGSPDIVLPTHKKAIFVNGCFWHGHKECLKGTTRPKTRTEFWEKKISANIERDHRVLLELERLGWKSLTIWECELRDSGSVNCTLRRFLKIRSRRGAKDEN